MPDQARVFISHSPKDMRFVRRLAGDLQAADLGLWMDERELDAGDSIVQRITDGLKDTDYLIPLLSKNSIQSHWVQAELNSALMDQLAEGGVIVLPALRNKCEIPPLLRDCVCADFRSSYDHGLSALLFVLSDERDYVHEFFRHSFMRGVTLSSCEAKLAGLSVADLRRRMTDKLSHGEVADSWFDTFGRLIDDELPDGSKAEQVLKAIDKAKREDKMSELIEHLCRNSSHIANS